MYHLSIDQFVWRLYLTMLVVIVPSFLGYPYAAGFALPVFISAMFGLRLWKKRAQHRRPFKNRSKRVSALAG